MDEYFGPLVEGQSPEESTSEHEPPRCAGKLEVIHLAYIASADWQRCWNGELGSSLKKPSMTAMFFHYFALNTGKSITARMYALTCLHPLAIIYRRPYRSNQSWPSELITKCENISVQDQLRKYRPHSDFLILKSKLPRLLVEVNSNPKTDRPEDLVRMLVTGAAVVRFANKFVDRFMANKNFVLCAMYIWDSGKVTRYSLFQDSYGPEVRCTLFITKLGG